MKYELLIQHGASLMQPPIADGVTVEWQRTGQPGKLLFECIKTKALSFEEGDACRFSVDGKPFFYGFVFEKSRTGLENRKIKVTVYDQIYYLTKNKDTYVFENKTAAGIIRMIAEDFHLNLGVLAPTAYRIESMVQDNTTLYDMIAQALEQTLTATGQLHTLYDKAGKLTLSNVESMRSSLLISENTCGNFDYATSITDSTYNRIKLIHEDKDAGSRKVYIAQDSSKINRWGVLQYFETLNDATGAQAKAASLLSLYNSKTRTLTVKNVLGSTEIRAGSLVPCILGLGDINLSNYMLVEQVKHTFKDNEHLMELKLRGGNGFVT